MSYDIISTFLVVNICLGAVTMCIYLIRNGDEVHFIIVIIFFVIPYIYLLYLLIKILIYYKNMYNNNKIQVVELLYENKRIFDIV